MNTHTVELASRTSGDLAGKYLTFKLSREQYAIEILRVTEIIGLTPITRVPRCPPHILGVINLRGRIIPLIDMRIQFGIPSVPYDEKTCIVVVNTTIGEQKLLIGIVVDTVLEVTTFASSQIAQAPEYGASVNTSSILGIAKLLDGDVSILLDIDKALNFKDSEVLAELAAGREISGVR